MNGRVVSPTSTHFSPMVGNVQTTLRFPRELRDQIRKRAERNRRTFGAELTVLVEKSLAAEQATEAEVGA